MRVLVTGATGQLGWALKQTQPTSVADEHVEVVFTSRGGGSGCYPLDLQDLSACSQAIEVIKPDWLINAAAYTAVDRAEQESDLAYAINAEAPGVMAQALERSGGRMLQVSTDFVFDGSQSVPYLPSSSPSPLGIYGSSKAAGEESVLQALGDDQAIVLRTSWVYGPVGKNFMLTMLRLHKERESISVVDDQVGCPTSSESLAIACWKLLDQKSSGIHHWSNGGKASWYDFAVAIGEISREHQCLLSPATVLPITTDQYPTLARRPRYSVLDTQLTCEELSITPTHWRVELEAVIRSLKNL